MKATLFAVSLIVALNVGLGACVRVGAAMVLQERFEIARRLNADLFLSIHADSAGDQAGVMNETSPLCVMFVFPPPSGAIVQMLGSPPSSRSLPPRPSRMSSPPLPRKVLTAASPIRTSS